MKKVLLLSLSLSAIFSSAQVLESDTFDNLNNGNLVTAVASTTPGQGGYYADGGAVADYQIVNGGTGNGKYLQVNAGNTATNASVRYAWKEGLDTAWMSRTSGNDIIRASFDFFTGTSTGSHQSGHALYGEDMLGTSSGLAGFRYNTQTKLLTGMAALTDGLSGGFYTITGISTAQIPANTWVTLAYTYDTNTGSITYSINGGNPLTLGVNGMVMVPGLSPLEGDILSVPLTGNAAATTFGIDNIRVEAINNATLATAEPMKPEMSKLLVAIGPNPASDYLKVITERNISKVEIYDLSGRKMPVEMKGNVIDIKSYSAGTYIINIDSKEGKISEKFIKK